MRSIRVHFDNGDSLETSINGTDDESLAYYIGKIFNLAAGEEDDLLVKAVKVEFLN